MLLRNRVQTWMSCGDVKPASIVVVGEDMSHVRKVEVDVVDVD